MYFPKPICCWYDMIWFDRVDSCCDGCWLLLSLHWFGKKSVYGCWFSCTYSACSKRVASSSFTCTPCVLHALFLCVCLCFFFPGFVFSPPTEVTNFQSVLKYQHCSLTTRKGLYSFVSKHLAFFSPPPASDPIFSAWYWCIWNFASPDFVMYFGAALSVLMAF